MTLAKPSFSSLLKAPEIQCIFTEEHMYSPSVCSLVKMKKQLVYFFAAFFPAFFLGLLFFFAAGFAALAFFAGDLAFLAFLGLLAAGFLGVFFLGDLAFFAFFSPAGFFVFLGFCEMNKKYWLRKLQDKSYRNLKNMKTNIGECYQNPHLCCLGLLWLGFLGFFLLAQTEASRCALTLALLKGAVLDSGAECHL